MVPAMQPGMVPGMVPAMQPGMVPGMVPAMQARYTDGHGAHVALLAAEGGLPTAGPQPELALSSGTAALHNAMLALKSYKFCGHGGDRV